MSKSCAKIWLNAIGQELKFIVSDGYRLAKIYPPHTHTVRDRERVSENTL